MAERARWTVSMFERKRNPDMQSRKRKVGGRFIPEDAIPRALGEFGVTANGVDDARRQAANRVKQTGRALVGMSVSAETRNTLIVYVFNKEKARS